MLCPRCQYDLTGLPEIHTCPECGFEYDPNAIFVQLKIGRILWNQILMAGLLIGAMIYQIPKAPLNENFGLMALILVPISTAILRLLTSRDRGSLTLNRFGVTVEEDLKKVIKLPWNEIRRVRFNWITGNVVVKGNRSKRIVASTLQVGGFFKARELAQKIRRLRAFHEH